MPSEVVLDALVGSATASEDVTLAVRSSAMTIGVRNIDLSIRAGHIRCNVDVMKKLHFSIKTRKRGGIFKVPWLASSMSGHSTGTSMIFGER
jgi:hypothetical protein